MPVGGKSLRSLLLSARSRCLCAKQFQPSLTTMILPVFDSSGTGTCSTQADQRHPRTVCSQYERVQSCAAISLISSTQGPCAVSNKVQSCVAHSLTGVSQGQRAARTRECEALLHRARAAQARDLVQPIQECVRLTVNSIVAPSMALAAADFAMRLVDGLAAEKPLPSHLSVSAAAAAPLTHQLCVILLACRAASPLSLPR